MIRREEIVGSEALPVQSNGGIEEDAGVRRYVQPADRRPERHGDAQGEGSRSEELPPRIGEGRRLHQGKGSERGTSSEGGGHLATEGRDARNRSGQGCRSRWGAGTRGKRTRTRASSDQLAGNGGEGETAPAG